MLKKKKKHNSTQSLRKPRKAKKCITTDKQTSLLTKYFHVIPKPVTIASMVTELDQESMKRKLETSSNKDNKIESTPKKLSEILQRQQSPCLPDTSSNKKYKESVCQKRLLFDTSQDNGCDELVNGCDELDNGYDELNNGCHELDNGCDELDNGCDELDNGCDELDNGCDELDNGCDELDNGCDELDNGCDELDNGCDELDNECDELDNVSGLFEDMDITLFDRDMKECLQHLPKLFVVKNVSRQRLTNNCWNEELIIELSINSSTSLQCCLRDIWSQSDIRPSDLIHLIGDIFDPLVSISDISNNNNVIISEDNNSAIIINPDNLISGTSIAGHGISCTRRAVLSEVYRGYTQYNEPLLFGVILHCVFQKTILYKSTITENIIQQNITEVLSDSSILHQMYSLSLSDKYVLNRVTDYIPTILQWCQTYLYKHVFNNNINISVSSVCDIEENVWSPRFGLKGKIDATVNITTLTDSTNRIAPLEVKTGKMKNKMGSIEHRAQVMLYCLLLSDVYNTDIKNGLLYYMKTNHTQLIPAATNEIKALLVARNHLGRYHGNHWDHVTFPEMIREQYTCRYCPVIKQCTLHYRTFENGTVESSCLGEFFPSSVKTLSQSHEEFFRYWYKLVSNESSYCQEQSVINRQIWRKSIKEREENGFCISNLIALKSVTISDVSGLTIKQEFQRSSSNLTNLNINDRIVVSVQDNRWGVALGYILSINNTIITLLLDRSVPCDITPYCIDLRTTDHNDGIGLNNLVNLCASDELRDQRLRQLIIDLDKPLYNTNYTTNVTVDNILADLNCHQREAVHKILLANDYSLLLGMPGTGKTTIITQLIRIFTLLGKKTLLSSYTNNAVDNVLLRLIDNGIDFIRIGTKQKVHPLLIPYTTEDIANNVNTVQQLTSEYSNKSVVACTCHSINHSIMINHCFDYCIIDEAGQITLPLSIGPLRLAKVFILVGDHYQLPPLVTSPIARAEGYELSLFKLLSQKHPESLISLTKQYRMNSEIMKLCNLLTYDGKLECASSEVATATLNVLHWNVACVEIKNTDWLIDAINPNNPVLFLNTDRYDENLEKRVGNHIINPFEIDQVCLIVETMINYGVNADNIMVITQYKHQQQLIYEHLNNKQQQQQQHIEVSTIDKCQGKDKQCVILSFVRSNIEHKIGTLLTNIQRINVALTRAKHKLLMIGSCKTLQNSECLKTMIESLQKESKIIDII